MKKQFEIILTNTTPGEISGYVANPVNEVEHCTLHEAGLTPDINFCDIDIWADEEQVEVFITGDFSHNDFVAFFGWNPAEDPEAGIDEKETGLYYEVEDNVAAVIVGNQRFGSFCVLTGQTNP